MNIKRQKNKIKEKTIKKSERTNTKKDKPEGIMKIKQKQQQTKQFYFNFSFYSSSSTCFF